MQRDCLVCGTKADAAALLCPKCGAPLPDAHGLADGHPKKPQPKQRASRQGRYLMVAAVGIVAIALVAVAMLWTKRGSTTPESILERLSQQSGRSKRLEHRAVVEVRSAWLSVEKPTRKPIPSGNTGANWNRCHGIEDRYCRQPNDRRWH